MIDAAAEYLWSVCGTGKLSPLSVVARPGLSADDNALLVAEVGKLVSAFRGGARLTAHRSGDGYERFREPYKRLIADMLDEWQRGEIGGAEARLMTDSRSYGALYGLARDLAVEIRFMPRDIAQQIAAGVMTMEQGRHILGIQDPDEMPAFLEAWTA